MSQFFLTFLAYILSFPENSPSRKVRWKRISTGVDENNPCMNPDHNNFKLQLTLMASAYLFTRSRKTEICHFLDFLFPPVAGAMCFHLDYQTLISIASFPLQPIKRPAHCAFLRFYFGIRIYSFLTRIVHVLCVSSLLPNSNFSFYCVCKSPLIASSTFFSVHVKNFSLRFFLFSCNITKTLLLLCTPGRFASQLQHSTERVSE